MSKTPIFSGLPSETQHVINAYVRDADLKGDFSFRQEQLATVVASAIEIAQKEKSAQGVPEGGVVQPLKVWTPDRAGEDVGTPSSQPKRPGRP